MKSISMLPGNDLTLIQPSVFKRIYNLKNTDGIIGIMDYPRFFSTDTVVEISGEKYEIKQPSIWRSEIQVLRYGQSYPLAKYESNFWRTKGVLTLPRGEKLNFKYGMFKRACEITTSSGELLIMFKNTFAFKDKNIVEIHKASPVLDENPWIIFLGWYIILQHRRSAAAG
ncbi:MAG: hypothetical protein IPM56_18365 [Ignavibacteriales bacterium]|nr:MAG: hypothetical protein IPM56_18365 [Ignavibacteriales bacterium]